MTPPSEAETILSAWFTIGGWVLALVLATWHWRDQIIDGVDWLLDRIDRQVERREKRPVQGVSRHVRLLDGSSR